MSKLDQSFKDAATNQPSADTSFAETSAPKQGSIHKAVQKYRDALDDFQSVANNPSKQKTFKMLDSLMDAIRGAERAGVSSDDLTPAELSSMKLAKQLEINLKPLRAAHAQTVAESFMKSVEAGIPGLTEESASVAPEGNGDVIVAAKDFRRTPWQEFIVALARHVDTYNFTQRNYADMYVPDEIRNRKRTQEDLLQELVNTSKRSENRDLG